MTCIRQRLLTTRIPTVRMDIPAPPLGIACLSTVKLDLVRPRFRSLSKSTDATLMNLKRDQFRPNSVGPRFCSALFFASTGSGFEQIVEKSTIPAFGPAGQHYGLSGCTLFGPRGAPGGSGRRRPR